MSQTSPNPSPSNGVNPIELTPEEQAARDAFDADGNPIEPPPAGDPPVGGPPQDPPTDPPAAATPPPEAPPPSGASASDPPAGTDPPAPNDAASPHSASLPALSTQERDFDTEIAGVRQKISDLNKQYRAGEIEDDAYDQKREEFDLEREGLLLARAKAETRQELAEEFAKHTWQQNVTTFLTLPENALLARGEDLQLAWRSAMQRVVNEAAATGKPLQDDFEIMRAGKDALFEQLGLSSPSTPPPQPDAPAASKSEPPAPKTPPVGNLPPTLGTLPAAAPTGAKLSVDELAGKDIREIEKMMSGMSEAQRAELLRTTAGAFVE